MGLRGLPAPARTAHRANRIAYALVRDHEAERGDQRFERRCPLGLHQLPLRRLMELDSQLLACHRPL